MIETLKIFFAMGGYGFYIWTAYFIVFVVLVVNFVTSYFRHIQKVNEIADNLKPPHEPHP